MSWDATVSVARDHIDDAAFYAADIDRPADALAAVDQAMDALRIARAELAARTGQKAEHEDGPDPDHLEAEFEAERRGIEDGARP